MGSNVGIDLSDPTKTLFSEIKLNCPSIYRNSAETASFCPSLAHDEAARLHTQTGSSPQPTPVGSNVGSNLSDPINIDAFGKS